MTCDCNYRQYGNNILLSVMSCWLFRYCVREPGSWAEEGKIWQMCEIKLVFGRRICSPQMWPSEFWEVLKSWSYIGKITGILCNTFVFIFNGIVMLFSFISTKVFTKIAFFCNVMSCSYSTVGVNMRVDPEDGGAWSSEMLVPMYQAAWHHIAEQAVYVITTGVCLPSWHYKALFITLCSWKRCLHFVNFHVIAFFPKDKTATRIMVYLYCFIYSLVLGLNCSFRYLISLIFYQFFQSIHNVKISIYIVIP